MKTPTLVLSAALAALALPAPATADSVEDDLALVRSATASAEAPARGRVEAEPAPSTDGPKWFRVRIVEKGDKRATVKVNLPLFLVTALGEDVPIPGCKGAGARGPSMTLGEVLRALDSGDDLVEIEDENATVRVWVE